jgi:hypothetical protein
VNVPISDIPGMRCPWPSEDFIDWMWSKFEEGLSMVPRSTGYQAIPDDYDITLDELLRALIYVGKWSDLEHFALSKDLKSRSIVAIESLLDITLGHSNSMDTTG